MSKSIYFIIVCLIGLSLSWDDVNNKYDNSTNNPCINVLAEDSCISTNTTGKGGECCFLTGFWNLNMSDGTDCYWNKDLEGPEKIKAFWDETPSEPSGGYQTMIINCKSYGELAKNMTPFRLSSWNDKINPYDYSAINPCQSLENKDGCLNKTGIEGECCFLEGAYWNGTKDSDCFWNRYGDKFISIKNFWDDEEYETKKVTCSQTTEDGKKEKTFDNMPWDDNLNTYPENDTTRNPCLSTEEESACLANKPGQGECCFVEGRYKENYTFGTDCFYNKYLQNGLQIKNFWDDENYEITKVKCPSLPQPFEPKLLYTGWNDKVNKYEEDKTKNPCAAYENNPDQCLSVDIEAECCVLTTRKKDTFEEGTDCFWNKYMDSVETIKNFWDDENYETTKIKCKKTNNGQEYSSPRYFYSWHDQLNPYVEDATNPCMQHETNETGCLANAHCAFITVYSKVDGSTSTDCFWNKYEESEQAIKTFWDDSEWCVTKIQTPSNRQGKTYPKDGTATPIIIEDDDDDDRLSNGAVAGIAIGCAVVGAIIGAVIACCVAKGKSDNSYQTQTQTTEPKKV